MALVVNTNIASLTAQNYVSASRKEMETAMERLSSGNRINSAADDAAGLAISTRMESQVRGLTKAVQNANDGISLAQTAEGAQKEITEMLQRMRELSIQAINSSLNASDRASLDDEVQQLKAEIDQIATSTQFNGQKLLDGSFDAALQIGNNVGETMEFSIGSMRISDLGLGSTSSSNANSLVSGRLDFGNIADVEKGDIRINGQDLGALSGLASGTADIRDVINVINSTIDNVEASGFNTVVMKNQGDGVASAGDVTIDVTPVNEATDSAADTLTFSIDASESLEELRDNINAVAFAVVTASINTDGKLVLSNDSGAKIEITDTTANGAATGIGVTAKQTYEGFIRLESTDGTEIRVEKGNLAGTVGTEDDLEVLGFRQVGADDSDGQGYAVVGKALDAAQATAEFAVNDLKINGVGVYNADLETDSIAGKVAAINAVSDQTGVTASAYFEKFYDLSSVNKGSGTVAAATLEINGVSVAFDTDFSDFVDAINAVQDQTGLSAELNGTSVIKLSGNVQSVTIAHASSALVTEAGFTASDAFATGQDFGGIRLESVGGTPIAIDLGEDAGTTNSFGFLELNVGAADFDVNAPFIGGSFGPSLAGLSVSSVDGANNAISALDRAIQAVSDSASELGAIQNRLGHTIANLQETIVNTEASQSRILDADFAVESARLAKQQVLQQASTAMLAQANASTQSVLTLLGG